MLTRTALSQIWTHIDSPDVVFLNGARQVGKTTLLQMIKDKLLIEKQIPENYIHWFDLEKVEDLSLWANQSSALSVLPLKDASRHFIFIDEFQKSRTIGSTLKVLHDHYPQFKIIVTGSASWYLTIDESLAGRKIIFNIFPLTFYEYLIWKEEEKLVNLYIASSSQPDILTAPIVSLLNKAFLDFITYGGYPAVVLAATKEDKVRILSELINSYLLRDVQLWNYAINSLEIKTILTLLASQIGSLVDVASLSINSQIGRGALKNRLELLQNTFILYLVRPYFTNKTKELIKSPKAYLVDTGLRGILLNSFSLLPQTTDFGALAENATVQELYKKARELDSLHYWRTKSGLEVDVVHRKEEVLTPIEIKSGDLKTIPPGIKAFIRHYRPKTAYVLNWSVSKTIIFENCQVHFRPLWFPV